MRFLFASTQGAGHFHPLVPFIDACLRHGHEALVVGPPTLDPQGYPFRVGARPPEEILGPLWERIPRLPAGQAEATVVGTVFARLNVHAMLPTFEETIEEWRPDVIVREPNEYASAVAADRHGLPHWRVAISLALVEDGALAFAATALDEWAPALPLRIAETRYLTCFPASFDPALFEVERFREPAVDAEGRPLPDWWRGDDRPLVYVTFGSVAATFPGATQAYAAAVEAVAELPVRVLVTVGRELELGPLPANVHLERWVPQTDVLPHAAAVVCHGGSGTTVGALAAGVPLVVAPLFADQPHNAMRVAVVGAGVVTSLDRVRPSLERVLGERSYRDAAGRVAAEMLELPVVDAFLAA